MPTNPTGRVDIVAAKLYERAVANHPSQFVRFLGSIAAPLVAAQFTQALGPGTLPGYLLDIGVDRVRRHVENQLHGMGFVDPDTGPGQGLGPGPVSKPVAKVAKVKTRPSAYINGKRAKFRLTNKRDRQSWDGRTIDVDAEVIG